jgi:hypothetical protein
MRIPLICHRSGDGDIARAFFEYYAESVSEFYLILHGPKEVNADIFSLRHKFPIRIVDTYNTPFDEYEKVRRLNGLVHGANGFNFLGEWVLLVDSDELVEWPYSSVQETIQALEQFGVTCMSAPMLQRLRFDGSLASPETLLDLHDEFPLCSEHLYELMGGTPWTSKFPLFKCIVGTSIGAGNHTPPNGPTSASCSVRGITHHFKWKTSAVPRLSYMIEIGWPWSETEAVPYLRYLESHDFLLPLDGAFSYSRAELFRRGLLRRGDDQWT